MSTKSGRPRCRCNILVLGFCLTLLRTAAPFPCAIRRARRRAPSSALSARPPGGAPPPLAALTVDGRRPGGDLLRRALSSLVAASLAASVAAGPAPATAAAPGAHAAPSSSAVVAADAGAGAGAGASKFAAELGLKPPTEDKPQIMMDGGDPSQAAANARKPILQGLVYFPDRAPENPAPRRERPLDYYSDVLVLTAADAARPGGVALAGAKFPVSAVRFPFSFRMYEENLLTRDTPGVRDAWDAVADAGDVLVRAQICPGDAPAFPCGAGEAKRGAEGVAKIITGLPGMREGAVIRAPASLALE